MTADEADTFAEFRPSARCGSTLQPPTEQITPTTTDQMSEHLLSYNTSFPLAFSSLACYAEEMKGGDGMEIYTLKEASRKAKIGIETLKRACEEGLIKATRLANGQWRIAESALSDALHHGLDLRNLSKRAKKKRPQPEGLRRAQEKKKATKHAA